MGRFPGDAPEIVVETRCPPLKGYSDADTITAAKEMQALRKTNPAAKSPTMFRDYGSLRAQCRAYQTVK